MRVLLVGGSHLMAWVVGRLAPTCADVEHCATFAEAEAALRLHPPRAVVFAVSPRREPWSSLADVCLRHQPPIPFFAYFPPRDSAAEAGAVSGAGRVGVRRPLPAEELRIRLEELIETASRSTPDSGVHHKPE